MTDLPVQSLHKDIFVFGASGRIGQALVRAGGQALARSDYEACTDVAAAQTHLQKLGVSENSLVLIAAGQINPSTSAECLERVNFQLASSAAQAAIGLNARAVTLGTVLETRLAADAQNAYVESKSKLAEQSKSGWLHLRLNTIYGGSAPPEFMFMGQLLKALKAKNRFSMTAGLQRREYHHVDDEARAILALADRYQEGRFEVNSGQDTSLAELARGVFKHFDCLDLLGIGDLPSPKHESYEPGSQKNEPVKGVAFRDTVPAVCSWLESCIQRSPE